MIIRHIISSLCLEYLSACVAIRKVSLFTHALTSDLLYLYFLCTCNFLTLFFIKILFKVKFKTGKKAKKKIREGYV